MPHATIHSCIIIITLLVLDERRIVATALRTARTLVTQSMRSAAKNRRFRC